MIKKLLLLLFMVVCFDVYAKCSAPDTPELPDAETAVIAEMVKAKKDVKKFLDTAKEYLECTRSDQKHDKMVDEMRKVADNFNQLVKDYKARVKE